MFNPSTASPPPAPPRANDLFEEVEKLKREVSGLRYHNRALQDQLDDALRCVTPSRLRFDVEAEGSASMMSTITTITLKSPFFRHALPDLEFHSTRDPEGLLRMIADHMAKAFVGNLAGQIEAELRRVHHLSGPIA